MKPIHALKEEPETLRLYREKRPAAYLETLFPN